MNTLPTEPRTVLILGANGRLGCAAARAFDAAGWRVLAQVRRDPSPQLPARAVLLRLATEDTAGLAAAAADASVIVHALNPIYTRWEAEALPALRSSLDLADRLGGHFMLPGNVYNYGARMPSRLREDTPAHPTTRKGEIRVQMEALIAQRAATGRFTASVLRAGDFFGAGTGNWFDMAIVKSLRAGKLVYPGPMDVPHAWAYLPDLADAFVRVAGQAHHAPYTNFHFEGYTLTGTQLLAALEDAASSLGLAPKQGFRRGGMPWALIATIGLVVPMWRELARMSYLWRVPHALDGRRLRALAAHEAVGSPQAGMPDGPRDAAVRSGAEEPGRTPLPVALRASLRALFLGSGSSSAGSFGAAFAADSLPQSIAAREHATAAAVPNTQRPALSVASGSQK